MPLTAGLAGGDYVRIPAGDFTFRAEVRGQQGPAADRAVRADAQTRHQRRVPGLRAANIRSGGAIASPRVRGTRTICRTGRSSLIPGPKAKPQQPVTQVSWFAATAYCEAQGARLPTWNEWEYAAAADRTRRDAREGSGLARTHPRLVRATVVRHAARRVGRTPANVYGVQDLHGLVWEWTDDYSALLVSADNRNQGDPDKSKFCGAGALSMDDQENYAVLMRVAMLSSLEAVNSTSNLGFRCARTLP